MKPSSPNVLTASFLCISHRCCTGGGGGPMILFFRFFYRFSSALHRRSSTEILPEYWGTFCGGVCPRSVFSFLVAAGFEPTFLSLRSERHGYVPSKSTNLTKVYVILIKIAINREWLPFNYMYLTLHFHLM